MFADEKILGIATIIRERIEECNGVDLLEPSALAGAICEMSGIDLSQTEALAWGENPRLGGEDIDRLASCFGLHRDLLAAILLPTSEEVLAETLYELEEFALSAERCGICAELSERLERWDELTEDDRVQLLLGLLAHAASPADQGQDLEGEPLEEGIWSELPDYQEPLPEACAELNSILPMLDSAAQSRVLDFAYAELNAAQEAQNVRGFEALRQRYLSPLTRAVFDELARSSRGSLTREQMIERLHLPSARSLGQLRASLNRALANIRADRVALGESLAEPGYCPLKIEEHANSVIYSLDHDALTAWQSILDAKAHA